VGPLCGVDRREESRDELGGGVRSFKGCDRVGHGVAGLRRGERGCHESIRRGIDCCIPRMPEGDAHGFH
jgi:hypothetical protein